MTEPRQQPPSKRSVRLQLLIGGIFGLVVLMGVCIAAAVTGSQQSTPPAPTYDASTLFPTTAPRTATPPPVTPTRDGSCAPQPCANDNYGRIVLVSNFKYDAPG